MKPSSFLATVTVLAVVLAGRPPGLSAQAPRGAELVITTLDGGRVSGELVAVKAENLQLLGADGREISVGLADIKTVRVVRKSKGLPGLLVGTAAGAIGGFLALYKATEGEYGEHDGLAAWTLAIAGTAGLAGLGIGALAGNDRSSDIAGRSKEEADRFWSGLRKSSREGRIEAWTATRRRPRLGLTLGMAPTASIASTSRQQEGTFRFPGEPAPEAGPYPGLFYSESPSGDEGPWDVTRLGPFCLTLEWAENWLLELDVFSYGGDSSAVFGALQFTSSEDGQTYLSYQYSAVYRARFLDLLAGVARRLTIPGTAERHSLEIGLAAGPALVSLDRFVAYVQSRTRSRTAAFCTRARAAWDYRVSPALSAGIFAEYRLARASAPATSDLVDLTFGREGDPEELVRPTEVGVPGFPLEGSRLFCGFRAGFRF